MTSIAYFKIFYTPKENLEQNFMHSTSRTLAETKEAIEKLEAADIAHDWVVVVGQYSSYIQIYSKSEYIIDTAESL